LWVNIPIYFLPLFSLPAIVKGPGDYLTRGGERATVESAPVRHDFNNVGRYAECGAVERWNKMGRMVATAPI